MISKSAGGKWGERPNAAVATAKWGVVGKVCRGREVAWEAAREAGQKGAVGWRVIENFKLTSWCKH